jgi:hypothetical protein
MNKEPRSPVVNPPEEKQEQPEEKREEITQPPYVPPEREAKEPRQEQSDPRESETREEGLSLAEKRTTRIPMGRNQRLDAIALPFLKPGFYHRFCLDKPGRLETYLSAGYEFVTNSNGKHVTFPSGANHLHLMKLPDEFRKEDLNAREEEIASRFAREVKIEKDEYSPDGAKVALTEGGEFDPDQ